VRSTPRAFVLTYDFHADAGTRRPRPVDRTKKHPLTAAMFRTFFPELSLALIPRLAHVGFSLTQPYLIHATITYVTFHRRLPEYYGYGLIGAYALVYTGLAVGRTDIPSLGSDAR